MSIDVKKRAHKEIHSNQNYLNFIKKNHQLIQQQFNGFANAKISNNSKSQSHGSGTFPIKRNTNQETDTINRNINQRSIHDSLSKFQLGGNQLNQISQIYSLEKGHSIAYDTNNNTIYQDRIQKNDQIATSLLTNKTRHAKHQAAKELLFHLNKNRSSQSRKMELKSITLDRYQTIPQPDLNLKFPIIEKKNLALTIQASPEKKLFAVDLRECVKNIDKREKIKNPQRQSDTQSKGHSEWETNQERALEHKFKIRQQLYGLLPVFRAPNNSHFQVKRNKHHLMHNKNKLRVQKDDNPPLKQLLEDYLQKHILLKSSPFSNKEKKKQKQTNAIINKNYFDSSLLQSKEQLTLLVENNSFNMNRDQANGSKNEQSKLNEDNQFQDGSQYNEENNKEGEIPKESQGKVKTKKVISELKYEGDLSIYELKIRHYRQFLFMVNLAHRIFDPITLKEGGALKPEQKYKFYMGKGNNYLLVKSLLKRRFWWGEEEDPKKSNFVWTQLKVNYLYQLQKKAQITHKNYKLDKDFQSPESPKKKKKKNAAQIKTQPTKAGIFKAPLPPNDLKIFTKSDKKYYDQFLQKAQNPEKLLKFQNRLKYFDQSFFKQRNEEKSSQKVHNHLQYNYFIGNKKALFYNLKQYYDLQRKNVFEVIPLTFHIKKGTADPQYDIFTRQFKKLAREQNKKNGQKNVWIVKPGELSNRGQGITVIDQIYQLNTILKKKEKHFNGTEKTYIVQKYIESPLLYKGRKFDIRHYMMISRLHGVMRAYWFGQGYIRTSSYEYNIQQIGDEIIHLTNDAIQKYSSGYGKYEEGNKVSYNQFQRYMDSSCGEGKFSFAEMIYPKMKAVALDAVKATYLQLDPNNTEHNFQIFGLDFMIDVNYNVWLIEVNTNPCLELSSKLLGRIIPTMLQQTLRLTLDVIFPPPTHYPNSQKYLAPDNPVERLQFQLIFDENRDGKQIEQLFANSKTLDMGQVDQEDETYQNDGKQIQLDNELD